MKKNIILFLILCLILILGFQLGRKFEAIKKGFSSESLKSLKYKLFTKHIVGSEARQIKKETSTDEFICNFEEEKDLEKWDRSTLQLSLTQEHCTEGASCLKAVFPGGEYPGLSIWKPKPSNWSSYDTLKFDVYNPYDEVVRFGILIKDELGDSYPNRYDGYFAFKPGENNFELNITGLKTNDKKRQIELSRIKELVIFLSNPQDEKTMYFDNIRLVKGEEAGIKKGVQQDMPTELIISDFEDKKDIFKWERGNLKVDLSKEHCLEGSSCLKIVFPKGGYPGLNAYRTIPRDWSAFDSLKFDCFNPQDEVVRFGILLKDELGDSYADRYDGYFAFKPGENNFELNITGLKTNDKKRQIQLDKIRELTIFLFEPKNETTLYLDNVRLEREKKIGAGNFYRFDFGTEYSEVWPGFTKVTDKDKYSQDKGYGWSDIGELKAEDRQYPDSLFRDWVKGTGPFNIDMPNGEYIVYMMLEDPGFWEYYQNYQSREVYAEGKLVASDFLDSSTFFRDYYFKHLETEDLPGQDVWDTYVKTRFTPKTFRVKVDDGQLNLKFSGSTSGCTLSALIIFPLTYEKEGMQYIQEINEKQKKYFNTHFVVSPPDASTLSFPPSKDDKDNGYILFIRDYMQRIYPNTVPREEELSRNLELFGAKGEFEPFTIGVYPLQDLGICEVIVEDLVNKEGKIIPSNNIDIRVVQYKLKSVGEKVYEIRGELLRKRNKVEIKKDISRQFWATVKIPEDTPAGDYAGKVHFKPQNGKGRTIKLRLRVLPFKLAKPDIAMGMFYFAPAYLRWYEDTRDYFWAEVEKQLWDLKEHNINSLAIDISPTITSVSEDANIKLSPGDFYEFIRLYKHFGFSKPIVGYGMIRLVNQAEKFSNGNEDMFSAILKNTYKSIKKYVDEMYGPEIIFCLGDEISNVEGRGIDYGVKLAQITNQVPEIKTTAMLNSRKDEVIFPYLDISTINNGVGISEETIEKINKSGSELWFYNIGQDRFTFGFYLAKTKTKGRLEWNYQLPAVDPYFDLDGRESDYCASYPSIDGPINSVWFEWIREGIDDYKYILTLSELIGKAKNSAEPRVIQQAKEAEETLKAILDDVDVEIGKNNWALNEYDRKRWQIAEQIVALNELLEKEKDEIASSSRLRRDSSQ